MAIIDPDANSISDCSCRSAVVVVADDNAVGTAYLTADGMWSMSVPEFGEPHPSRRRTLPPFSMTHRQMIDAANAMRLRRLGRA